MEHGSYFTQLYGLNSEDEQRHYRIVQSLKNQEATAYIEPDASAIKVRNVFERARSKDFIPKDQEVIAKLKSEQVDVYRAALTKEKESVKLYMKMRETCERKGDKEFLGRLMHEEEKHAEVLDNIILMFNRVNEWVESAEFHHQKPY